MYPIQSKLEKGEDFTLYIGRVTCPYCRKFVPNLSKIVEQHDLKIYYLDADKEDISGLKKRFEFSTVPNLSHYGDGKCIATLEKGSESTIEEIESLLLTK